MYTKLRKLRNEKNYSGIYIAEKLNITKEFYYQIESGKRKLSYSNAVKIACVLNLKPDEIFYDDQLRLEKE